MMFLSLKLGKKEFAVNEARTYNELLTKRMARGKFKWISLMNMGVYKFSLISTSDIDTCRTQIEIIRGFTPR